MSEGRYTVLVVDDDAALRSSLKRGLAVHGFDAEGAESGSAAIARLEEARFDAVLLDLMVSERSGLDIARAIRQQHPELPVLLVSGYGGENQAQLDLAGLGAVGFVQKPLRIAPLAAALAERIKKKIDEGASRPDPAP